MTSTKTFETFSTHGVRSTQYIMKFDNNKNRHVNFINKIIKDLENYCYKCDRYETSWCDCKFTCLKCLNLGDYLAKRNCHCNFEEKNRLRNMLAAREAALTEAWSRVEEWGGVDAVLKRWEERDDSDSESDFELEDNIPMKNFFHNWDSYDHTDVYTNTEVCWCPICEKSIIFSCSFEFEPYQGTYDACNRIEVNCSSCDFKYNECNVERTSGNDLYNTGLYEYKVFLENKLGFENPSKIITS